MKAIKKFFGINEKYKFEMNDVRCLIQIVNVALIMIFGLSVSWFGLTVAVCGLIKDFATDRHINSILMHTATAVLNLYFLKLLYFG
jgi:hypothetical protein